MDSTLDGRFRYIPKTSYNQQAQSCKMKGELVDLDDKRTFGDRCWKEIDWHKKRLKEQTKAEDFSDDGIFFVGGRAGGTSFKLQLFKLRSLIIKLCLILTCFLPCAQVHLFLFWLSHV